MAFEKKTQIYVSDDQWRELLRESSLEHTSVADLIRRAIDAYLATRVGESAGFEKTLRASAGIWQKRRDVKDGASYVEDLRHGWTKREKR